jgi:hypothetical protein
MTICNVEASDRGPLLSSPWILAPQTSAGSCDDALDTPADENLHSWPMLNPHSEAAI